MRTAIARRAFLKLAGGVTAATWLPRRASAQGPIRIGFTLSATGPYAVGAGITQRTSYDLWFDQVNAKGGLAVAGGGRRPIVFVEQDDRSELETIVRSYEKLVNDDKVDLVLPPWGTAANFAVAPITNKAGYPMIGPTVGSLKLKDLNLPYFYAILAQPDAMMLSLANFLKDVKRQQKLNKVAVVYVNDLFGLEHHTALMPLLKDGGFEVVEEKSYPLGVKDLTDVLKGVKAKGAEILIGLSYPPDTILLTTQAKAVDYNPPIFYTAVGTAFPFFRDRFKGAAEGVMGVGAWNPKVSFPGAQAYFDAHVAKTKKEPDRWASAFTYSTLQIIEESVGKVGLDRGKIKAYIDATEFTTVTGPIKFVKGVNVATPGMVGQWQKGEFEVVWPPERATGKAIVPKPSWGE